MKRPLRPDEAKLWAVVAATVRPATGKAAPKVPEDEAAAKPAPGPSAGVILPPPAKPKAPRRSPPPAPADIEPKRKRRIAREREDIGGRLDLHGMDQDRARAALHGFLLRAYEDGRRAVLVITGKGMLGDGVLRRRAPEWLADPAVRHVVAGVSEAARRHGGAGALYVALKRKA